MKDEKRTKKQLIAELTELRRRVSDMEQGSLHNLLASIVAGSEDAIIGKDLDGLVRSWNSGAERLYGYREDEIKGRHISILTPADQADEITVILETIKRGGRVSHYETTRITRNGVPINVSLAVSPIRDANGTITGASTIARDITDQRKKDEALRLAGTYNRNLIEASLDPLVTIDPEGKISDVNAATELVTGYSRAELIQTDFCSYFTDPEMARAGYQQVFREGSVRDYGLEIRHRDGHLTPVLYNAAVYRDKAGKVIGVFAAARDISERKRAERQVRVASLYARNLIETSLDPLVTISADGKVMDVNKATEEVTGLPRERLIGSDFLDYFTEPEKAKAGYEQAFREGFVRDYPLAIRHAGGRITEVLYNATTYRNEEGDVQGVFAAARDVSELRKAQEALQKSHNELERRVAERTAELESFSYSVSHDLRAPLRAIDGYSRMILRKQGDQFDEDILKKFAGIRDNARMMGQLIEDLLAFSRLGRASLSTVKLDMDALVSEVWRELQAMNPGRQIDFKAANLPVGRADKPLLKQVFVNILSNAVKFTKERGGALIEVGGYRNGNEVVYFVKDNGVGFDMAYHDKMFGVFQRLHSSEEYEGTGIGLALVQRIVHRHGGRIWAEGELNRGATFYFTLPMADG